MKNIVLISVPTLRRKDLQKLPALNRILQNGTVEDLTPSFPCVTCCVQANMTTGVLPEKHGIVANGLWQPENKKVVMWTATNQAVESPQLWDMIYHHPDHPRSAVWFQLQAVEAEAEFVCTHKPIHNPDGTETLWCYTRPVGLYGEFLEKFGHFPLHYYWGPMTNNAPAKWCVETTCYLAEKEQPEFFYIYMSHPDCQAQRFGPDSPQQMESLDELNTALDEIITRFTAAYDREITWFIAGEYVVTDVDHVIFPNRILRDAHFLSVEEGETWKGGVLHSVARDYETFTGELPNMDKSRAFAMCDHQFAHIYVPDHDSDVIRRIVEMFSGMEGVEEVLVGEDLMKYGLHHPRSGQIVLVSSPNSWMQYYWWNDDTKAPHYARRVDIHQKPGYDALELFLDPVTKGISLDTSLLKGSHGVPARDLSQKTVLVCSSAEAVPEGELRDVDVYKMIMDHAWKR
ncbi:MAG: alkaline phosphatase family protein [Planctomycetia bacterium]|nr:alkaline phosphatase family protein [Planctomycetia bacterium]